jgi:hypothetical protein
MSTEQDRFKNSRRRLSDESAVKKQTRIAKQYGSNVEEPHRFAKHHAMNCGDPRCMMCGNPRKVFNEHTTQEKRLFQDTDAVRKRHSNGKTSESTP